MHHLIELFKAAEHIVVFSGAGMSTESGLPDFRSKDRGLWEKFNPDELANVNALRHNKEEFTSFYQHRLAEIDQYQAHAGHKILAKYEKAGKIDGIITQNVDGFHRDAGSANVMELHGSFRDIHCHDCHQAYTREAYLNGEGVCDCGGTIRPGITLFGEMLPQNAFRQAEELSKQADLFIVFGSSLTVSPANMFPLLARDHGAHLVIVNREPTPYDTYADVVIQDRNIKEVLELLDKALTEN